MAILVRERGNSSKFLPLQPTPSCQFYSGAYFLKSLPIAAHTYMAISVRGIISKKCSIAAYSRVAISARGGGGGVNFSKVLPLQPNSYIILHRMNKIPPHSYINLPPPPPIDKLPPPTLTTKWEDFREDIPPGSLMFPWPELPLIKTSQTWN